MFIAGAKKQKKKNRRTTEEGRKNKESKTGQWIYCNWTMGLYVYNRLLHRHTAPDDEALLFDPPRIDVWSSYTHTYVCWCVLCVLYAMHQWSLALLVVCPWNWVEWISIGRIGVLSPPSTLHTALHCAGQHSLRLAHVWRALNNFIRFGNG